MTRQTSGKWRALLQEAGAVERRFLVRRAAFADRAGSLQRETGFAAAGEVDADLAALGLLEWDREHGADPSRPPMGDGTPIRAATSTRNTRRSSSTTRTGLAPDLFRRRVRCAVGAPDRPARRQLPSSVGLLTGRTG